MIISASRRTDIPAFYADWFIRRIREGFVRVRNPFNPAQIRRISLMPDAVDAIIFWTKNPHNILPYLDSLRGYVYYFLFTLTAYGPELEKNVPDEEALVNEFRRLSGIIGPERVIWRYDPVIITDRMNADYHLERFERLAAKLQSDTRTCIISFLCLYEKCKKNLRTFQIIQPDDSLKIRLTEELNAISVSYGIRMQSCAEVSDLTSSVIRKGSCIDHQLITNISGKLVSSRKDPNQRKECLCVRSIDIGAYHTCPHGCMFCYANVNIESAKKYISHFQTDNDMM